MTADKIRADKMTTDKIRAAKLTVDKMSLDEMSYHLSNKTFGFYFISAFLN